MGEKLEQLAAIEGGKAMNGYRLHSQTSGDSGHSLLHL